MTLKNKKVRTPSNPSIDTKNGSVEPIILNGADCSVKSEPKTEKSSQIIYSRFCSLLKPEFEKFENSLLLDKFIELIA